jgi:hypothetical protein
MLTNPRTSLIAVLALALTVPASALAKHGNTNRNEVRVAGSCGSGATSKLKLKDDDSAIETEFEVDNNRVGTSWRVVLVRDGRVVYRGTHVTRGPSGSFSVERRIANLAGADRVTARAVGPRGITCTAAATLPA